MNVKNVIKLIDHLESIDDSEYNQRRLTHECGSPACVAGHTAYIAGVNLLLKSKIGTSSICDYAAEYLGLSEEDQRMFFAYPFDYGYITTKREAIIMLRNFLETEEVVWRRENEC